MLNENSDAPVFFLQHKKTENIVLIDKEPDHFPEDYVSNKIDAAGMNFGVFQYLYDESKKGKIQAIKRK